jgi:hypothetical protein
MAGHNIQCTTCTAGMRLHHSRGNAAMLIMQGRWQACHDQQVQPRPAGSSHRAAVTKQSGAAALPGREQPQQLTCSMGPS